MGIMKMVSEIQVAWIQDLVPKLKAEVNVLRLSGRRCPKVPISQLEEEAKDDKGK